MNATVSPARWSQNYIPTLADWQAALLYNGEAISASLDGMTTSINGKISAASGSGENITLGTGSAADANLTLTAAKATNRTSISMSEWQAGTDQSSNGGGDFFISRSGLASVVLTLTADGRQIPQWTCNTVNATSAYDYVGAPVEINAYFGTDASTPMAASAAGIQAVANVFNTKALPESNLGHNTYSEFSAVYTFLQGFTKHNGVDCVHANEHYIGYDNHLVTPYTTDATKRPAAILGMSYLGQLLGAGSETIDGNGNGSYLSSMVTTPLSETELAYYGAPSGSATQPFTAMYFAGGYTGGASVTSGDQPGAGKAATYGFLAGNGGTGVGGSVYINAGARSKFDIAALLGDWTTAGLIIGKPIGTETPSGGRQYGIYNPYCTYIGGQLPDQTGGVALYLTPPTSGRSRSVALSIGDSVATGTDGWSIGRDSAKSGANDLYFYTNTGRRNMLWMSDDTLGFYGTHPVAQPTMWTVGTSGALSDCINAINRITSNLTSLGLFGEA